MGFPVSSADKFDPEAPDPVHLRSSLSSMMSLMRQHSSYNLLSSLVQSRLRPFLEHGSFEDELTKFVPD